jgi:hypothetical protein
MPTLNSTRIGNATTTSAHTNAGRTAGVGLEGGGGGSGSTNSYSVAQHVDMRTGPRRFLSCIGKVGLVLRSSAAIVALWSGPTSSPFSCACVEPRRSAFWTPGCLGENPSGYWLAEGGGSVRTA